MKYLPNILAVTMMALVMILAIQNAHLRSKYEAVASRDKYPYIGMYTPVVHETGSNGRPLTIGRAIRSIQVLYFFNTRCPHCADSIPAIQKIADTLSQDEGVEMVALTSDSAEETEKYMRKHFKSLEFVSSASTRLKALFHAQSVPILIAVDTNGIVRYTHVGRLDANKDVNELLKALSEINSSATTTEIGSNL